MNMQSPLRHDAIAPDAFSSVDMVNLAWEQSGAASRPGNEAWFFGPRMQGVLAYRASLYGPSGKRKFGNRVPLIHEVGSSEIGHHFPGHETDAERAIAEFSIAAHDIPEALLAIAKKKARRFFIFKAFSLSAKEIADVRDKAYTDLAKIWGDAVTFSQIVETSDYITDNPRLHGDKRIQDQIDRSFDANGVCIISPLSQLARGSDKLNQVEDDAWECERGNIPLKELKRQIAKAKKKA